MSTFMILLVCLQNVIAISHKSDRSQILREEALMAVGGKITLTHDEEVVNKCLMQRKFAEMDYSFDNPQYFNFSHHYFHYKNRIGSSKVYEIIKMLPKGAALHVHDMAMIGPDYLLNVTYAENLYVCFQKGVQFRFSSSVPTIACDDWMLMSAARQNSGNTTQFDAELRKHFTIVITDPEKTYTDINSVWDVFMSYFKTVAPLLTYRPIWEQYFYDALKQFRDDNLMYVEVRSVLPNLYELDGTVYDTVITAKAYEKAAKRFVKDYPDFLGVKVIYAPSRFVDNATLSNYLQTALKIKATVNDFFAGFDLVGQEDLGKPLLDFLPQLEESSKDLNYFFHAGETNWYGTSTDENLIDAILLGTKRLGHAYALAKHPVLMEEVRKRDIALEVNVISNEVLCLVRDVRNHPLATFLAEGLPVVLSSDDPGIWEAVPLSHDFYVAFEGVASKTADLKLLKQLALNSITYSAMTTDEKKVALMKFHLRWQHFVKGFKCDTNY